MHQENDYYTTSGILKCNHIVLYTYYTKFLSQKEEGRDK